MVNLTSPTDGVQARITVNDLQGHLLSYSLAAYWGDGASATIFSDSYAAHRNPAHQWNGVVSLIVPAGEWTPTVTCAYQFRLSASPRVTNGYGYLGYAEDTYHVTLIKSAASPPAAVGTPRLVEARYPLGQSGEGLPPAPGVDATRLGAETFEG
jgi:hypothetical protein